MPEASAGSAADWLRHARSNLALARAMSLPDVLYSELCFHAQQAVEQSLKAVLIDHGIVFHRVHDIGYLLGLLPPDLPQPHEAARTAGLTRYAVMTRYPGDYEEVTEAMYQEAVEIAQAIFIWAEQVIGSHGSPQPTTHDERPDDAGAA